MRDIVNRGVVLILWIVLVVLAIKGKPIWLILLASLHFLEMIVAGFRAGMKYGKGILETIVCCMAWGYLWWLPLIKRMKHDELTEKDFVEDGLESWRE